MPTAEEDAQERAVFDTDDSDTDDSADDDSGDDDKAATAPPNQPATTAAPPPPPPPTASTAAVSNADTAFDHPSAPAADPSIPQNGAVVVSVAVAPTTAAAATIATALTVAEERRPLAAAYDESRRLFQRLWTDDDEIKILQGFLEFTSRRGTTFASHQYDTGPFYEDIKKQLQLEFTKNQLIEKLRRLKKKYRNCVNRMRAAGNDFNFKSAHEKAVFDIARNIWSANVKRTHDSDDDDLNANPGAFPANSNEIITIPVNEGSLGSERRSTRSRRRQRRRYAEEAATAAAAAAAAAAIAATPVTGVSPAIEVGVAVTENMVPAIHTPLASAQGIPSIVEETVKSCLSPLFKELISSAVACPVGLGMGGGSPALKIFPLGLGSSPLAAPGAPLDEKWKEQQVMELEVYLKRIELVRDQIKMTLEELKSSSS